MTRSGREIVTDRTALRPFCDEDADELLRLFRHAAIREYLLDDTLVSAEWMRDEIAASRRRFEDSGTGLWSARAKGKARIIGFAGFREFFDPPVLQLLYGLLPEYWGQGLATEIARSICDHAFLDLSHQSVSAAIDVPNTASRRVLERLGMELVRTTTDGAAGTAFFVLGRDVWETRKVPRSAL